MPIAPQPIMYGDNTGHRRLRVAVVGAGIAGCCLTIGLSHNQLLDVHLYEAYSTVSVRGAGLALHGNAITSMDLISPAIKKAYFRKSHFMANEEDMEMATQIIIGSGVHAGTLVAELGRAKGRRTVHRAHFIQGLLDEAIPKDHVHFGKRLVSIEETHAAPADGRPIVATFSDGTAEKFDVLFGSEGVKSVTRKYILEGHPATYAVNHDNWRCFHASVPMEEAKEVLPKESIEKVRMFCTPLGYINGLPVDLGQTYSISCYQRSHASPLTEGSGFNADQWKGFCAEVTSLISLLERKPEENWKIQDHDHAPTYYRGRVAMIGDAAHATGPHAGNGAAQAIEDAAILSRVFGQVKGKGQIEAALKAFDEVRRPRSQKVVEITRQFGRLYSQTEAKQDVGRMKRLLKEGGMYTNGVDMNAQAQAAVLAFKRAM
ncbi:hypothetical protein M426DRAFT_325256 [Hypoxylon sp. CI-4A]|nr:hypothetical protein M426DRAFT_325256 [Hypoxylon sp. CI-4A]